MVVDELLLLLRGDERGWVGVVRVMLVLLQYRCLLRCLHFCHR